MTGSKANGNRAVHQVHGWCGYAGPADLDLPSNSCLLEVVEEAVYVLVGGDILQF